MCFAVCTLQEVVGECVSASEELGGSRLLVWMGADWLVAVDTEACVCVGVGWLCLQK